LGTSAAWAIPAIPTINIDDLLDGNPVVTPSGFPSTPIIHNPIVATLDEFANVFGLLKANFLPAGFYGARMKENALDPSPNHLGVSDFAVLFVSPEIPIVNAQAINLTFLSDGALNFDIPVLGHFNGYDAALDAYVLGVKNNVINELTVVTEDAPLQNLFKFDGLVVNAKSDAPVPIPASVFLFGTGLLGLVPVWRLRRKA
jgi:hypothetical protein